MSRKRRNTSSSEHESPVRRYGHTSNYDESDEDSDEREQPRVDITTGLAGAFPGLVNESDDGMFYGPAYDGLDYLRMVRSEAKAIPLLLTANDPNQQPTGHSDDQTEDYEGFFDGDEAFVAAPIRPTVNHNVLGKAQQMYYHSLMLQLYVLRERMKTTPPLNIVQTLPESIPISFPASSRSARVTWSNYISMHPAHPVQIACMDSDSVFELIRLVTKQMRKLLQPSKEEDIRRIGSWVWAMLAKCPDRGELGSEEIADLRMCAKTANMTREWLQARIDGQNSRMESDIAEEDSSDDAEQASKGESRPVLVDPRSPEWSDAGNVRRSPSFLFEKQHVILDMIITVVGESYGQQDLLALRKPWVKDE